MAKKLLTISLLVSGREDTTEKCLDSLKGLLEQLDSELILVDTGCGDALKERLKQYTDRIIPFTWCHDFAKARNAGLSQADGEWFLFLDDDEWFEDVTPIIEFFKSGEYKDYEQAVYKARNYSKKDGTAYSEDWVSRMIRLREDTHFEGKVHESLAPTPGKCKKLDAFVHHFGYAFDTDEERQAHFKRNLSILSELMKEEPDNLRWWVQVLPEYIGMKDHQKLLETAEEALAKIENVETPFMNLCRGAFYSAVLKAYLMAGDYKNAKMRCQQYCEDARNSSMTLCSLASLGMDGAREWNDTDDMVSYAKSYFKALSDYQNEEKTEQEQIIEESIIIVKDAVSEERQNEMRLFWGEALARQKKPEEFPKEQSDALRAQAAAWVDGNADFLNLPEIYWTLGLMEIFPLEEILLELPFSQWMAQVAVLEQDNDIEHWGEFRDNLNKLRSRDDIRYIYFTMHDANQMVANTIEQKIYEELGYEEITGIFRFFAEGNMRYARTVYTEKAFEGGMEMLPESCRGAVWVEKMLACEDSDWDRKLDDLGKCVKEYPVMAPLVKYYAQLFGREQEEKSRMAQEAADEMKVMAQQIKQQLFAMMEKGMYAEAYEVAKQLREILPNDEELARIEEELSLKFS